MRPLRSVFCDSTGPQTTARSAYVDRCVDHAVEPLVLRVALLLAHKVLLVGDIARHGFDHRDDYAIDAGRCSSAGASWYPSVPPEISRAPSVQDRNAR
jgi:hypothetical protein